MRVPDSVTTFLEQWHASEWSVATLPYDLGVKVRENRRGRRTFARCVSVGNEREITLHPKLFCATLYIPILAHECSHLLLDHEGTHPCRPDEILDETERLTWLVAAHVAVPASVADDIRAGERCIRTVARDYGLPLTFVAVRVFGELAMDPWIAQLRSFEVW